MNSYFALHLNYKVGEEFHAGMGYGFAANNTSNNFRECKSGKRIPPTTGDFVYICCSIIKKSKSFFFILGSLKASLNTN